MKRMYQRTSSGLMMIVLAMLTVFLLLPIGIFAFEVSRVTLAQTELRAATDAAALAASAFQNFDQISPYWSDTAGNDPDPNARLCAAMIMQQNCVTGVSLSGTTQSASAASDNMAAGACECWTTITPVVGNPYAFNCTTTASFGLKPAFAMLGLPVVTVRATSTAGPQPWTGDICFAVDVSGSMQFGQILSSPVIPTATAVVQRHAATGTYNTSTFKYPTAVSYTTLISPETANFQIVGTENTGAAFSNEGWELLGINNYYLELPYSYTSYFYYDPLLSLPSNGNYNGDCQIVSPSAVDVTQGQFFKNLQGQSQNIIEAAEVEAQLGNLENTSIYQTSGAYQYLGSAVSPQAGWQIDYQRLAIGNTHPLADEMSNISDFVNVVANPNVWWSLVMFSDPCTVQTGTAASDYPKFGTSPQNLLTFNPSTYPVPYNAGQLPVMPVGGYDSPRDNGVAELTTQLQFTPAAGTTRTSLAITQAVANLTTGPGRHPNLPHAIIMVTDGLPNNDGDITDEVNATYAAATAAGKAGVPIYVIGYWGDDSYSAQYGPGICANIAAYDAAAGGTASKSFAANTQADVKAILNSLAAGVAVGLHN